MARKVSATRAPPLECRDDLFASLQHAWEMLSTGARKRTAAFHLPALATVNGSGQPRVRTVVLRAVDPGRRRLRFHTDIRSAKIEELRANPIAAMLLCDEFHKIQVRLSLRMSLLSGAALEHVWSEVQHYSRICYHQAVAPGTVVAMPSAVTRDAAGSRDGRAHFAAVEALITEMEWLYLASDHHRRARFSFDGDEVAAQWLAP